ncbi:Protein of unknown function [Pseudovibrio denitrificans]|uniref:DUF1761 domain-containing protein n=1 Tax=Pseudovibrio denitrificans TaxID=258256 RepID=A0A1I7AQ31_9HYPH|nr:MULTISPECIES: DUF1761 domain-containing protein [Pseudovibrio]SFT77069.1 Protein of unknown function [Pseudovibrio denitrificans]
MIEGIYLPGVLAAGIASYIFGSIWYYVLSYSWMKAVGISEEDVQMSPSTYVVTFLCEMIMAFVLAGILVYSGSVTIISGITAAIVIWGGFVLTGLIVNHKFQRASWMLTFIDAGHWLGVLMVQGAVYALISG